MALQGLARSQICHDDETSGCVNPLPVTLHSFLCFTYASPMTAVLLFDPVQGTGWLADGGAGSPWSQGSPLPAQTRVIAVVPAESVTLHRVSVPARRAAELRQALPFALEDRLATAVEDLHFAPGSQRDQLTDVAVVARSSVRECLQRLSGLQLSADHCLADAQLLPRDEARLHAARIGGRLLLANRDGAWAIPVSDWPQWQSRFGDQPLFGLTAAGGFVQTDGLPADLDRRVFLRLMAPQASTGHGIDLLQGEFAPLRQRTAERRLWRWAAVLAGLAIVLVLVDAAIGVFAERQRRDDLRAQMAEVFRQALPEARMTADPAAQLVAELGRQGGGATSSLFDLLRRAAPAIAQGSRYRLQAIDFRLGVLELEVATADVASLDALRESLASSGLAVELTGVDPGDEGVRGRLRLRGGNA